MRSLAFPLAVLIVVAVPLAGAAAVVAATRWGRWMVTVGGVAGVVGLLLTAGAVVSLGVARSCTGDDDGEYINRPVLLLAVGDGDCRRDAVAEVGLVVLVGGLASAVAFRRSGRRGGGAVPVAPLR